MHGLTMTVLTVTQNQESETMSESTRVRIPSLQYTFRTKGGI